MHLSDRLMAIVPGSASSPGLETDSSQAFDFCLHGFFLPFHILARTGFVEGLEQTHQS